MKIFVIFCALILFAMGCVSNRIHEDTFASLRNLIIQKMGASCDCGLITTNAVVGGRLFEVQPKPQGLSITVFEREFYTQSEWERRYAFGTNSMSQFMNMTNTNHSADYAGFTNAFGLLELPEWHYQNIGVQVEVEDVDIIYPGLDKNEAAAQKSYEQIVKLLKPYHQIESPHYRNRDSLFIDSALGCYTNQRAHE